MSLRVGVFTSFMNPQTRKPVNFMFILRWIKRLVVLALMVAGVLYLANYQWHGKSIKQHIMDAHKSGLIAEGMKDIKTWIGEIFNAGKKVAGDKLTIKDREALEQVIKNELKENVKKLKEEAEKGTKEEKK